MIIQCEKCQTRFRLDDSRVTAKGVKVRCTKCKHVFRVQKEGPEAGLFEPDGAIAGLSSAVASGTVPTAASEDHIFAPEPAQDSSVDFAGFDDTSVGSDLADARSFETPAFDASEPAASDGFHTAITESAPAVAVEPAAMGGVVDFSSFDFGDTESDLGSTPSSTLSVDDFTDAAPVSTPVAPRRETPQGLDFSDDDMFGAVVPSAPEATSDSISFDFEGDSFAESMEMSGQDSSGKSGGLFSLDSSGDAPFNLGEIDFGDELTSVAVQQVNPEDLKPSQEILFAPLAEAREKSEDEDLKRAFLGEDSVDDLGELPPLSIASRRKQSPLFSGLIAVVALLVISALGYFGYSSFSTPKVAVATDNGKISVQDVKAAFIENDEVGELLVISGEALNEYPKPRAALQIKVDLFDATGKSIATKSAYGGNPLTEEQLESLPLDKIEAAMANQFGDSLANMEVAPGTAIPFVVVLSNLPKGVKDFGVQSAGSTVATGKQQ
ncbi:MAG: DUF3426 domain-containing protein [Geobacteraceae bacterium]|nr:DUF3426 domain-containing protein [Geobacteraceae bacterium]